MERLTDDDRQHGAVRELGNLARERLQLGRREQVRDLLPGVARATPRAVEVDLRPEVVEVRGIRGEPVRRRQHLVRALAEEIAGGRRRAGHAVPVQHGDRRRARSRCACLALLAERDGRRLLGRLDVGVRERRDRLRDVLGVGREVGDAFQPLDPRLEHAPAREPVGEQRVGEDGAPVDVDAATLGDLDVVRDRVHDLRQRDRREALLDLALECLHELLLTRDPVEVRVRVPVANVVERLPPGELLVARLEVDLRVAERAAAVVEVAPIDVDPGAVESVDDLPEAAEVDRDQVVDLHPGEEPHGLQRALRPAGRVCGVDLVEERRPSRAADLDAHVAREREERDRVGRRIGPDEHEGVGAPGGPFSLASVVPDHERDRGLPGQGNRELAGGLADLGGLRGDRRNRLVEIEIRPAGRPGRDDETRDPEPHRDPPDEADT